MSVKSFLDSVNLAFGSGSSVFVSHLSGKTTDDFVADLTVGLRLRTGHLKVRFLFLNNI